MDLRIVCVISTLMAAVHCGPNIAEPTITVTDACSLTFYPNVAQQITITAVLTNDGDANLAAGDNLEGSIWLYPNPDNPDGEGGESHFQLEDSVWTLTSGSLGAALNAGDSMTLVGHTTVEIPEENCEVFTKLCVAIGLSDAAQTAGVLTVGNNDTMTGGCVDYTAEGATCDASLNAGEKNCDGPDDEDGAHQIFSSLAALVVCVFIALRQLTLA